MTFKRYTIDSSDLSSNPVVTNFKHPVKPKIVSTSPLDKIMSSKIVQAIPMTTLIQLLLTKNAYLIFFVFFGSHWKIYIGISLSCFLLNVIHLQALSFIKKFQRTQYVKYNPLCIHSVIQFENVPIQSY